MAISRIPRLSDEATDIGEKYMVARHRRNILEGLGMQRHEIPSIADEQILMLKALKIEQPETYVRLYDLFVRGVQDQNDSNSSASLGSTHIAQQKKEAMAEMRALAENLNQEVLQNVNSKMNTSIAKFLSDVAHTSMEISKAVEAKVEAATKKLVTVEKVFKVAELPAFKPDGILPEEFDSILGLAANRVNILLVGPSGCGKTHISAVVAQTLNLTYHGQSCSAGMSESIFSGWLLPIGDSGKFSYVQSPFITAYENGGVFLFDEIDAADGNTLLFLNQALAQDHFFLPQRFDNPKVQKHKDFVAIAAANTFGAGANSLYNSRNALDAASMDRFRMGTVEMDYSAAVEEKIINKDVLFIGRKVRELIKNKSLRKILSTRFMLDASKMLASGWSLEKVYQSYSKDWSKEEQKLFKEKIKPEIESLMNPPVAIDDSGDSASGANPFSSAAGRTMNLGDVLRAMSAADEEDIVIEKKMSARQIVNSIDKIKDLPDHLFTDAMCDIANEVRKYPLEHYRQFAHPMYGFNPKVLRLIEDCIHGKF